MFTLSELQVIRTSLDIVTIKGADAKFLAQLQNKVEQLLFEQQELQTKSNDQNTK